MRKKVALFGMGRLYKEAPGQGALVVGFWSTAGYEFSQSTAVRDNFFVGLALDEDNQSPLTEKRIQQWCKELLELFV